ncbi:DUF3995 domain-containing protein [Actinosynnema sp. NPDC047251]|uniref:Uncharacterized protein n=1 Tax=Saccharothrix espanaensis (strain ATCC 51144 / DSM 44229 / JCM 9112 / NBRC 15066 / NRRL 15764) TaxID=1179773 RepID=K0JXE6_SACES|nr:DUF3995 domain-containing protein [Saccharothrix espanaensis]CCH30761.1 hypothetical protein BN6_34630 [Saccharothrix espanaensis DSM 44229]
MTLLALLTALALVAIGGLHVVWAFSPWPLRSREEFASRVVGVPTDRLPSRGLTLAVAGLLAVAAYLVAARGGLVGAPGPAWLTVAGAAGVAAVMLLRGAGGLVSSARQDTEFARLDLRIYSPLCLGLAAATGLVAALA